jgi:hypothetical protein
MYIGPFGNINAAKLKLYMNPEEGDKDKGGDSPPTTKASLLLRAALNIDKSKIIVDPNANLKSSTSPNTSTSCSTNPSTSANPNTSTLISPELYDNIIQAYNITKNPKTDAAMLSRFSEVYIYMYIYISLYVCINVCVFMYIVFILYMYVYRILKLTQLCYQGFLRYIYINV